MALVHADRMYASFQAWLQAEAEHRFYLGWVNNGRDEKWEETAAECTHRLTFGRLWQLTADVQGFINAAAQVEKCVRTIGSREFPDPPPGPSIRDVRNFEEHWENPFAYTVKQVKGELQGDIEPGQMHFTGKGLWVANLSMFDLVDWVRAVQQKAAVVVRESGIEPPTARHHLLRVDPPSKRDHDQARAPDAGEGRSAS
ncbi:hypothetical protein [Microbacterium sp. P03]|uniref:hypothetical protein n=1 Tax=Microbacterium sp. P03 TaxID=3366946 RepID=UPI0037475BA2